ncbi:MAG: HAD family hydrolase [Rhizomicrobium sp.]
MTEGPVRIAMWSGPRNISTAMMRAFENRADTAVIDEPFYAAYLSISGTNHPLREKTLAAHESDWRKVVKVLTGPVPGGRTIFYQKHMTHHMLPEIGRGWMPACRNVFLIRAPEAVLASYSAKRAEFLPADIGFASQREMFEAEAERLGTAPPVIDAEDVLRDPHQALGALCTALKIAFAEGMLHWPSGSRATDGAWAPAWYDSVAHSTGFAQPRRYPPLDAELKRVADAVRPHYECLARHKLAIEEKRPEGNRPCNAR